MKKSGKYIIILVSLLLLLVLVEYNAPKVVNWTATFERKDKIPFGTYVLYENLNKIFSGDINPCVQTIYQEVDDAPQYEKQLYDLRATNYLFITDDFSVPDEDLHSLIDFVNKGNNVFIASERFSINFLDTLGVDIGWYYNSKMFKRDSLLLNFVNETIESDSAYMFSKYHSNVFFSKFDTLNTFVLGQTNNQYTDFIKIESGYGFFYLSTQPYIFTNYSMLKKNYADYTFKALSYLPQKGNLIWDEYYKPYGGNQGTVLRYILNQDALYAAFYTLIIGMLVYVFFESKRRQRIIPVIKPPKNTSLEFISTVGRLYLHTKNHKDLADKKYRFFKDFMRTKYYIKPEELNRDNFDKISEKTGVRINLVRRLIYTRKSIEGNKFIQAEDLIKFNDLIDRFYSECK